MFWGFRMEESLPVSEVLKVIESTEIYKSDKWWSAVVLLEAFGKKQIAVYVWNKKNGSWKRRQKFVVKNKTDWERTKNIIEGFLSKL